MDFGSNIAHGPQQRSHPSTPPHFPYQLSSSFCRASTSALRSPSMHVSYSALCLPASWI